MNNKIKNSKPGGISPQAALVLDYLSSGRELTPLIAHMTLGVASLTARIAELRANGYGEHDPLPIQDAWKVDHFNRRYKSYWMPEMGVAVGPYGPTLKKAP